ncbi:hypothetical protein S40288_11201 [Stachybotrys chartarum IBT 40288]|nr:hypothetical protein S40288_11201 [Stachybotrys chartarum IBT 40288]
MFKAPALSPGGFRRRSHSRSPSRSADIPPADHIIFPKVYEDAWGNEAFQPGLSDRNDLDRARIFLMRYITMNPDQVVNGELRAILMNQNHGSIVALASAIQTRIFGNRHGSFKPTPLLQSVRFMLIKSRITEVVLSDRTKAVIDFFFDPAIEKNIEPLPRDYVSYPYPAGRLKVTIIGGGPTALASAISLAERGRDKVEVHLWERRWVLLEGPRGPYVGYPSTAKRRDQVVTLQESVTRLMSKETLQALFQGRPERVWPGSANIQIRKVEDRLLNRCQDEKFRGLIHLHCEGVTRDTLHKVGDFHVLLGADGAASWVRKSYFHGYENERGRSYALGLAFDRPAGLPWSQPLNIFLTLGQTRYLLNASDYDGRGYLNMQLTEEEWHKMVAVDGEPVTFGRPGCIKKDGRIPAGFEPSQVFAPSEDREGPLWRSISDGLKLFGFKENEVINVVRIPIIVQAVREGVQYLLPNETYSISRPHALVAVAGDAAMTVHFWPGRGLNSGIKSGMALGDELVHALNDGKFFGMQLSAMKAYNDFIMKLQDREHDKRSIPILNQSGAPETLGWLLDKANSVPDNVAVEWLVGAMNQIADRLQRRGDWPFEVVANVEPQLRIVLRQLEPATLQEMAVSFPWPTREMAGAEVLPIRSMKPEEKEKWVQQLWRLFKEEREKESVYKAPARFDGEARLAVPSASRFEAPRAPVAGRSPQRSGAVRSISPSPTGRGNAIRESRETNDVPLGRLMSVHRKPTGTVLGDAMSLALFRVDSET